MSARTLAVVSAGLSEPSSTRLLADRLTTATTQALTEHGVETEVVVVELREHAHDLANNLLTGVPTGRLGSAVESVTGASGLIAVTPVFNASYSGLFKTFFDVLDPDSLTGLPVLAAATGGTPRHSLALEHAVRPMFAYLRAVVVPTTVYAASADWGSTGTSGELAGRIRRGADELARLMSSTPRPAAPVAEPTPFEQLLAESQAR